MIIAGAPIASVEIAGIQTEVLTFSDMKGFVDMRNVDQNYQLQLTDDAFK